MWFWKVHGVNFNNETFIVTAGIPARRWTSEKASYSCLYVRHRELWENDYRFPWPLKYQHTHRHSLQTHTDLPEAAMLHNHSLFFVWSDCNFSHLCSTQKEKGKKKWRPVCLPTGRRKKTEEEMWRGQIDVQPSRDDCIIGEMENSERRETFGERKTEFGTREEKNQRRR